MTLYSFIVHTSSQAACNDRSRLLCRVNRFSVLCDVSVRTQTSLEAWFVVSPREESYLCIKQTTAPRASGVGVDLFHPLGFAAALCLSFVRFIARNVKSRRVIFA